MGERCNDERRAGRPNSVSIVENIVHVLYMFLEEEFNPNTPVKALHCVSQFIGI